MAYSIIVQLQTQKYNFCERENMKKMREINWNHKTDCKLSPIFQKITHPEISENDELKNFQHKPKCILFNKRKSEIEKK